MVALVIFVSTSTAGPESGHFADISDILSVDLHAGTTPGCPYIAGFIAQRLGQYVRQLPHAAAFAKRRERRQRSERREWQRVVHVFPAQPLF